VTSGLDTLGLTEPQSTGFQTFLDWVDNENARKRGVALAQIKQEEALRRAIYSLSDIWLGRLGIVSILEAGADAIAVFSQEPTKATEMLPATHEGYPIVVYPSGGLTCLGVDWLSVAKGAAEALSSAGRGGGGQSASPAQQAQVQAERERAQRVLEQAQREKEAAARLRTTSVAVVLGGLLLGGLGVAFMRYKNA